MKHAIMVMGYGNDIRVLQKMIDILDDDDIDFYIHWDKRWPLPNLSSHHSKISIIKKRIAVKWGSFTQVEAEYALIKSVYPLYDYVHLVSAMDMPLMTVDYFKQYFTKEVYIGFSDPLKFKNRLEGYYPNNIDFRKHRIIFGICRLFNSFLRINRLREKSNFQVHKGPNWFSIKGRYLSELVRYDLSIFEHTCFPDEEFVQTILGKFDDGNYSREDNAQAARYIDWHRGGPYVFTLRDVPELRKIVNTDFAFARKVMDPRVIDEVMNL
jgi:hypothetical protein